VDNFAEGQDVFVAELLEKLDFPQGRQWKLGRKNSAKRQPGNGEKEKKKIT
jgi:hypothetical protein